MATVIKVVAIGLLIKGLEMLMDLVCGLKRLKVYKNRST